jgi:hypothetical protein
MVRRNRSASYLDRSRSLAQHCHRRTWPDKQADDTRFDRTDIRTDDRTWMSVVPRARISRKGGTSEAREIPDRPQRVHEYIDLLEGSLESDITHRHQCFPSSQSTGSLISDSQGRAFCKQHSAKRALTIQTGSRLNRRTSECDIEHGRSCWRER